MVQVSVRNTKVYKIREIRFYASQSEKPPEIDVVKPSCRGSAILRVASLRVASLRVASLRVASLRVVSLRVASLDLN